MSTDQSDINEGFDQDWGIKGLCPRYHPNSCIFGFFWLFQNFFQYSHGYLRIFSFPKLKIDAKNRFEMRMHITILKKICKHFGHSTTKLENVVTGAPVAETF